MTATNRSERQFDRAPSEMKRHTLKAALVARSLRNVPGHYHRQNRCKNHQQTNRSPLCFWILHILLLVLAGPDLPEPPENACGCVRDRLPTFACRQALYGRLRVCTFDFARNSILRSLTATAR
jgi:hypothetical protein